MDDLPRHTIPRERYGWSKERTKHAVELFENGFAASKIGGALGITRNAVIGKMKRLGVKSPNNPAYPRIKCMDEPPPVPAKPKPKARIRPNMQTVRRAQSARKQSAEAVPLMSGDQHVPRQYLAAKTTRKKFMELAQNDCRWPCGTVGQKDFWFCGGTQADATPYCAIHCAVAYQTRVRPANLKLGA